jgi:dethiobiotin synthetase
MDKKSYFITGIGTDVGKTVVSAIFAESLCATYWKPVQAGDLDFSDTLKIKAYCSENVSFLLERYRLNTPASPHLAAKLDGIEIQLSDFELPQVDGNLLIEGAGGLLVPINEKGLLYIDLIQHFNLPVILVSRHYLGSINHTLLSLEALKNRNINVEIIVFVGDENTATESIILTHYPIQKVIRIPLAEEVNSEFVSDQATIIQNQF